MRSAHLVFLESRWAYALKYITDDRRVQVVPRPTDCDFFYAPIWLKGCHYEESVQVMRYSTDVHSGEPIVSYTDGKTWYLLPKDQTPGSPEVYVTWDRVKETQ